MADKSTVISLVPFAIDAEKPGLYPGFFHIEPAENNDFEFLVVGRSRHYVFMDSERGSIPVFSPSDEVARSICEDYIKARSGQGITPGIAEPGLFFVDGEYKDKKAILVVHKELIDAARDRQRQWFINLVELADDEWNKYHLHRSISDMMRFAANFLGLEREWNVEAKADSIQFCPACKMTIQTGAIICGNCRTVIDKDAYKKAGFQPAGV